MAAEFTDVCEYCAVVVVISLLSVLLNLCLQCPDITVMDYVLYLVCTMVLKLSSYFGKSSPG